MSFEYINKIEEMIEYDYKFYYNINLGDMYKYILDNFKLWNGIRVICIFATAIFDTIGTKYINDLFYS